MISWFHSIDYSQFHPLHYEVIMSAMASQITRLTVVYSTVYSDTTRNYVNIWYTITLEMFLCSEQSIPHRCFGNVRTTCSWIHYRMEIDCFPWLFSSWNNLTRGATWTPLSGNRPIILFQYLANFPIVSNFRRRLNTTFIWTPVNCYNDTRLQSYKLSLSTFFVKI